MNPNPNPNHDEHEHEPGQVGQPGQPGQVEHWIATARAALRELARPSGADLRGRVLGAARDRAWRLLTQHLQVLAALARASNEGTAPAVLWDRHAETALHLARRLSGLGVALALQALPARWAESTADTRWTALQPWLWLAAQAPGSSGAQGTGDAYGEHPWALYQPSAAPSFLDSLAPR